MPDPPPETPIMMSLSRKLNSVATSVKDICETGRKALQTKVEADITLFELSNSCEEEVKAKWKNLRDNFNKELKKIPTQRSGDGGEQENYFEYPGKWQHFTQLLFLKDVLIPRVTEGNLTESLDTLGTSSLPIEVIDSSQIPIRSEEFSYEIIEAEDVVLSPSADIPQANCEQEIYLFNKLAPLQKSRKRKMSSFEEKLLHVEEEKL
ncbi:hypothetical protein GE061_000185 [Apolygus lucorum]|uniref:MADF domain-containing protein n=1 Tax=Apolygus lucorum TaxID=248454 RepID=A0A8S9Y3J5_APOLU|nr:hypothetical protein GE061_000185 [Apolygus lucorum]